MAKKKKSTKKQSIGVANPGSLDFYPGSDNQILMLSGFTGEKYKKAKEVQNFKIRWMVRPVDGTTFYPASESSSQEGGVPQFELIQNCIDVYAEVSVESVKHTDKCSPSKTAKNAYLQPPKYVAQRVSAPGTPNLSIKEGGSNSTEFEVFTARIENYSDSSGGGATLIEFEFNSESGVVDRKRGDSRNGIATVDSKALPKGHEYRVRAKAIARSNTKFRESTWSNYSSAVKTKPGKPGKPKLEPQVRTTDAFPIKVSWAAASGAETYHIEWNKNKDWFDTNDSEVHSADTQSATTSIIVSDGLDTSSGGGLWYFRVRGHNNSGGDGNGPYSDLETITIGAPPAAPTTWSYETILEIGQDAHLCWTHNSEDGSPMTWAKFAHRLEGAEPIAPHIPTEPLTILYDDFMRHLPAVDLEDWNVNPKSGTFTSPETERVFTYSINDSETPPTSTIEFDEYILTYDHTYRTLTIEETGERPKTLTFKDYKSIFADHFPYLDYVNALHRWMTMIVGENEAHGDLEIANLQSGTIYSQIDSVVADYWIWVECQNWAGDISGRLGKYIRGGNPPSSVVLEDGVDFTYTKGGGPLILSPHNTNRRIFISFTMEDSAESTYSSPWMWDRSRTESPSYDPKPYNRYFGARAISIYVGYDLEDRYIYGPYDLSDPYLGIVKIHYDEWEGKPPYDIFSSDDYYVDTIQIEQPEDPTKIIKTYVHPFPTTGLSDSQKVYWKVATKGVLDRDGPANDGFGEYSVERSFTVYSPPSLTLTVEDGGEAYQGDPIPFDAQVVTAFPITITAHGEPDSQTPIGFNFQIISRSDYDITGEDGTEIHVTNGEVIWERYYTTSKHYADLKLGAGSVFLQNETLYSIHVEYTVSLGLSAESSIDIFPSWTTPAYSINAEVAVDTDNLVAFVRPFLTDANEEELTDGAFFSIYRRDSNGEMIELATHLDAADNTTITDIHPALDFARYRVVAVDKETGAVSFDDIPGATVGERGIVIHWDEAWQRVDEGTPDFDFILDTESEFAGGSLLRLPYNVDVSDDYSKETSLIYYAGRRYPVSYYGDQRTLSSTWSTSIPKSDTARLHAVRRLAMYGGDSYVREPNGTGYWASLSVSYSITHNNPLVPISIKISRVAEHEDSINGESSAIEFTSWNESDLETETEENIDNGDDTGDDDIPLEEMEEENINNG